MKKILLILLTFLPLFFFGQKKEYETVITVADLESIIRESNGPIDIKNTHITNPTKPYFIDGVLAGEQSTFKEIIAIDSTKITFYNCKIDDLGFTESKNLNITISRSEIGSLYIINSSVGIRINNSSINSWLSFENSDINNINF